MRSNWVAIVVSVAVIIILIVLNVSRDPIIRLDLVDLSYADVLRRNGNPISEVVFTLDSNAYELRSGLSSKIPDSIRSRTPVLELSWKLGSDVLVAWFIQRDTQWVCIDALEWNPRYIKF
jgi:hypothetical protein